MGSHNQVADHKTAVVGLRDAVHKVKVRMQARQNLAWGRFARACWRPDRVRMAWVHSLTGHNRVPAHIGVAWQRMAVVHRRVGRKQAHLDEARHKQAWLRSARA